MNLLKNFLLFTIKSALIVGLLSSLAWVVLTLIKQEAISSGIVFVASYGAGYGAIAGAIGFWVMWCLRKLSLSKFTMASYGVALVLGVATLAFFYGGRFAITSFLEVLVFPVIPFFVSVFLFTKLSQKHIRSPL